MTRSLDARATGERRLTVVREEALRQRLLARDEQALVELVDVATPWLLAVAQGVLRDASDAEDIVMDTFRIAWTRIELVRETGVGLMPWLLQVARNRSIDRLRARRRHAAKVARVAAETVTDLAVPPVEPDEAGQPGWHVHNAVQGAINALPNEQQVAVRLAYFQGLTHSEIAEHLGIPIGTVKTRLRLAFDKLRVSLTTVKDWVL